MCIRDRIPSLSFQGLLYLSNLWPQHSREQCTLENGNTSLDISARCPLTLQCELFGGPTSEDSHCRVISGHGEKRCSSLPTETCSFGLASERTPFARPPHQLKVFGEEGEGFGEREGKLSRESFPSLSPISFNYPSSHLHPCAACRRTWRRPPTGKAQCSRLHHWGKPLCRCLRTWKGRPAGGTRARA